MDLISDKCLSSSQLPLGHHSLGEVDKWNQTPINWSIPFCSEDDGFGKCECELVSIRSHGSRCGRLSHFRGTSTTDKTSKIYRLIIFTRTAQMPRFVEYLTPKGGGVICPRTYAKCIPSAWLFASPHTPRQLQHQYQLTVCSQQTHVQ